MSWGGTARAMGPAARARGRRWVLMHASRSTFSRTENGASRTDIMPDCIPSICTSDDIAAMSTVRALPLTMFAVF